MCQKCLEHFRLVVLLVVSWLFAAVATRTLWTSVVAAWATVTSAVITTWTSVAVVTAWTTVSAWLALWLDISLRLLDEGSA